MWIDFCKYFGRKLIKFAYCIGGRRFLAAIYACPNDADDGIQGIHSDHGYLDTCGNPLGPP